MSKQNGNKGRRFDRAFKEEAVRLLQTSGRRQRQIAGDLGISVSALGRWVAELREEDLLSGPHEDAAKEITRLRRERDLARQERDLRDLLKKSAGLLRQGKSMRFRFIDAERAGRRGRVPVFAQIRARPFFCPNLASSWNQISSRLVLGRAAMWASSVRRKFF